MIKTIRLSDTKDLAKLLEEHPEYVEEAQAIEGCVVLDVKEDYEILMSDFRFAKLNKNETIERYQKEIDAGEYDFFDICVRRMVACNPEQFQELTHSFMSANPIWAKIGGTILPADRISESEAKYNWDLELFKWPEKQMDYFRNNSVQEAVLLVADGQPPVAVDTQGYDYARYVGL